MFHIGKAKVIRSLHDGHHLPRLGDPKADMKDVFAGATEFIMGTCNVMVAKIKTTCQISGVKYGQRKLAAPQLKSIPPTATAFH